MLSNWSTIKCGVAEFGRQHAAALSAMGHKVVAGTPIVHGQHWPEQIMEYDILHANFHPLTIGHITPPPDPHPPLSVFKHEPPGGCSLESAAQWIFAAEQAEPHYKLFPMPCLSYVPPTVMPHWRLVGTSTLRRDGIDWVKPVAEKLGLTFDYGQVKDWWSIEAEIRRLSQCAFLAYWYGGPYSGQSAAVMTGVAAQRPILLNRHRMFDSLLPYSDELYFSDDIEDGMKQILSDLERDRARVPRRLKRDRQWETLLPTMTDLWSGI